MGNLTEPENNRRYGLVWKTNNKVGKEKKSDLKKAHKKCVLVGDNGEKELNDLSDILKKYNYDVIITQYEEKALKIFRKKRYNLLITVITGMIGVDHLGKIKILDPQTEVMIVTGLKLLESCLQTINSGSFIYQNKLNKTQVIDKKCIKNFRQNEFRLMAAMGYYLERYSFWNFLRLGMRIDKALGVSREDLFIIDNLIRSTIKLVFSNLPVSYLEYYPLIS